MAKQQIFPEEQKEEGNPCSICGEEIETDVWKLPDSGWVCEQCYFGHGIADNADDD